ncbi:MAG: LysM peptidoglycan-binding domain-containing protein [Thermodesulfobacteriota bacterium]|nr:LysM peptidoglycan-binding domain-containing protein [Thermodesulfobacteriota bacterium]
MSKTSPTYLISLLFFLLLTVSACISLNNGAADGPAGENIAAASASDADPLNQEVEVSPSESSGKESTERLTIPEPEKTVVLEVKKLEALGKWEEGSLKTVPEKKEIQYDFPVTVNKHVEFYLDFFQNRQHETFARWLERSGRYLPLIQQQLKEAGLPLDLVYLPMIESGFSLTAYSRAKAVGPWQFIKSTGRHYGLVINSYVDERRDPVKSTRAAVAYLSDLYDEFGSWHLAVAGYNTGEGRVRRAVRRYKTDNFWELAQRRGLKSETKRYVPKLIAAIIIAKDPAKYGFNDIKYKNPLTYETIEIPRWTSLRAVSVACDVGLEELRHLNRELRRSITPPGPAAYSIKVPVGKKNLVACNLPMVKAIVNTGYKTHVVRDGENLQKICKKYKINGTTLLKANNLRKSKFTKGQRLRIPFQTTTFKLTAKNEIDYGFGPAKISRENLVLHKILPGETVSSVAKKYCIPEYMIAAWNNLNNINRITAGEQLALYLNVKKTAGSKPPSVKTPAPNSLSLQKSQPAGRVISAAKTKIRYSVKPKRTIMASAGKKNLTAAPPAGKVMRLTYYQVQGGDTLWDIARKFKLTPAKIKEWNDLKGNLIHPGNRLIIKLKIEG